MSKPSKRVKQFQTLIEKGKRYSVEEAIRILKKAPHPKFDESVDFSAHLGLDLKQTDQGVRSTVLLPNGTGKKLRVIVFCRGELVKKAEEAGCDFAGSDELINKINGGWLDFDVAIATPDMMKDLSKLGKLLGPRGLMPSPKAGTVTMDVATAVRETKRGKIEFKADKAGNINCVVGKISFEERALGENVGVLIEAIQKSRPASLKGEYIKGSYLSTTMGPGVRLAV